MFTNITNLIHLKGNLYITDFLDIFIIGLLIYTLFIFLRRTRTFLIFMGIAITVVLYLLAKSFNLYVTLLTLKYFVGVSVIIFAIIFQNEIRKYFEFLGLIGTRQIKVGPLAPRSPSTAEIIQASVQMAQAKTGALIVIEGKDSIDRFIEGGIPLDGVISEEVLLSIFDDHSAGHDGAIIVTNNRISKFAAHLPLSNDFKEIGKHGTRHSAALGLAEVSDALCIVVSEESGKISVCRDSKMKTLVQFTDLEKEIDKFIKLKFLPPTDNILIRIVKNDFWLKVMANVAAIIIWFFVAYQAGIVEKTYNASIIIENTPEDVVIKDYSPKDVKVVVNGRGKEAFSKISDDSFKVTIDLAKVQNGINKNAITRNNIEVPANLSLVSFTPEILLLTAQKYSIADVSIAVKLKGALDDKLELKTTEVSPTTIKLWIPQEITVPSEIPTEEVDLTNQKDSVIIPVKLIIPEGIRPVEPTTEVNVALTITPKEQPQP